MMARARDLVGRRIVAVDFRRWYEPNHGWLHDPILTLDNGRRVWFVTEESDGGEYGCSISISERPARPARSGRGSAPASSAGLDDAMARGAAEYLKVTGQAAPRESAESLYRRGLALVKGGKRDS